ncbi:MAG: AMP-binding protein [Neisseriaceae bacterium]|nr:AMP-binding protein [Neisseriaceae bacterium]
MFDLGRTFLQSVERSPHATALVDDEVRLSYQQWHNRIMAIAGAFQHLGLKKGDHLLVVMQNRWQMATIHWATQFLGIVIIPLNWRAKADEVAYCIADADIKAVCYEPLTAEAVVAATRPHPLLRIGVNGAEGADHDFDALLQSAPFTDGPQASAQDMSLMLYTSGTTGKPKGVPRRHRQERAAALAHVAQNLYARGEVTLGVMPLYHTMGVRSLLAMALIDGCFVCLPKFDVGLALALIEQERVSNLYLVPTLYHDMLNHPDFARRDHSSVTKLGYAGASMSDGLLSKLQAQFQPELFVNHYGSSEVYTFTITQDAVSKAGSAGKAGINTRIKVVKLGSNSPDTLATPGEEGEIIADLQGDEAFEGYWRRPDADAKTLKQGWYFTGDIGYQDKEGDLFVTGRIDDMIISGGENISPVDIESILSLHPCVDEVAVAGIQDERWGKKVVAFIKRKDNTSAEALDHYCRDTDLANYKRPRDYVFVAEIPKSPVGKILRHKLVSGEYQLEHSLPSEGDPQ